MKLERVSVHVSYERVFGMLALRCFAARVLFSILYSTLCVRSIKPVHNVLCRLGEPGIKELCLEQFRSAPLHRHHPVSIEFLGEDSKLLPMVLAIQPGRPMDPILQAECDSIADISIDGSVAEAPHAKATKIGQSTRAASWPWISSSMRLGQNLTDATEVPLLTGISLQRTWNNWKSVVQMKPRHAFQNRRMSDKRFTEQLYSVFSGDLSGSANQDASVQIMDVGGVAGSNTYLFANMHVRPYVYGIPKCVWRIINVFANMLCHGSCGI